MLTQADTNSQAQRKITIGEPSEYIFKDIQLDKHGNPIESSFEHDSKKSVLAAENSIRKKNGSVSIGPKKNAHQFSIVLSEDNDNINTKYHQQSSSSLVPLPPARLSNSKVLTNHSSHALAVVH